MLQDSQVWQARAALARKECGGGGGVWRSNPSQGQSPGIWLTGTHITEFLGGRSKHFLDLILHVLAHMEQDVV